MENTVFKLILGSFFVAGSPLLAMDDNQEKDSPSPHRVLKSSSSHSSSSSLSPKVESGDVKASTTWRKRGQSLTNSLGDQKNRSPEREKTSQRSRRGSVLENHESSESKKEKSTRPPSVRSHRSSSTKGEEESRIEKKDSLVREESLSQDEKNMKRNKRNSDKRNMSSTSPRRQQAESRKEQEVSFNKEQNLSPTETQVSSNMNEKRSPREEENLLLENRLEELTKNKQMLSDLEALEKNEPTPPPLLGISALYKVTVWFPLMSLNEKNRESIIYALYLPSEKSRKVYFEENKLGLATNVDLDSSRTTVYNRFFRLGENYNKDNYIKSAVSLKDYIERDKQYFTLMHYKEENRIDNKYIFVDGFTATPKLLNYGDAYKLLESGLHQYDHEIPLIKENDSLVPLALKKNESNALKHNIPPLILQNFPQKSLAESSENQQCIVEAELPKRDSSQGLSGVSRTNSPTIEEKKELKETKADIPKSHSSSSGDSLQSIRLNKKGKEIPHK